MKVTGKDAVKLTLHEIRYTISNVYWILELKNNLLSVGQLQEKGLAVLFKDVYVAFIIHKKEKISESIMSTNPLFILRTEPFTTTNEGRSLQVSKTD